MEHSQNSYPSESLKILKGLEGNPPAGELYGPQKFLAPYTVEISYALWTLWTLILLIAVVRIIFVPWKQQK